jgi:Kef-type K+ transport system membrane component KefB
VAHASGASDTFTRTTLLLILMITLADVCGFLFERLGMAEILGEIYAGILLGNLALVGIDYPVGELLRDSEFMQYSSELALVLLLFLVGLESDVSSLLRAGRDAAAVALGGVVLPIALGIGAATALGMRSSSARR